MPFGIQALRQMMTAMQGSSPSTHSYGASPAGFLQVLTPEDMLTPPDHSSPTEYLGPNSSVIQRRNAIDCARSLMSGRLHEALQTMSEKDKL
jgi:hypothetical protein